MFEDETTTVLVRAALELAVAEHSHVQIALRREPHSKEERQKLFGVPTLIAPDLSGHVQVTVRLDDGAAIQLAVERIFGVKRI